MTFILDSDILMRHTTSTLDSLGIKAPSSVLANLSMCHTKTFAELTRIFPKPSSLENWRAASGGAPTRARPPDK